MYWKSDGKGDSYEKVVLELLNGNSFLMFPTANEKYTEPQEWSTIKDRDVLKMASIVNVDGLKVLGAFTDEQAMLSWTKKPTEYTAMRSQDVLKLCENNGFDRIVINTASPNTFVIERNKKATTHHIKENSTVQVGTPDKPLSRDLINKLIDNFRKNEVILEVYHYGMTKEKEFSLVLGFKLSSISDEAHKAAIYAVQDVVSGQNLDQPLDIFFLEKDEWYARVKQIQNALIYEKKAGS